MSGGVLNEAAYQLRPITWEEMIEMVGSSKAPLYGVPMFVAHAPDGRPVYWPQPEAAYELVERVG